MTPPARPLLFAPVYKERPWGGRAFETRLGKCIPQGMRIGESWEIAGFEIEDLTLEPSYASRRTLRDLLREDCELIAGPGASPDAFPLLCKFIDACDRLSVQVHPNDAQATANGWGRLGKTEAWYIVDAVPGAQIIVGFTDGVGIDDVREGIANANLDPLLNVIDIRPGDALFVPAGTVHAVLAGTLLYEVQESSDTTFRLYDWGRVDKDGKQRALHIEQSLAVLDTSCHDRYTIQPLEYGEYDGCRHWYRVACRYFALEEFSFETAASIALPGKRSFRVVTVLDGEVVMEFDGGEEKLSRGQTALIPAALHEIAAAGSAGAHLLLSSVPDLLTELVGPLRRQGIADDRIALLGGHVPYNDILPLLKHVPEHI